MSDIIEQVARIIHDGYWPGEESFAEHCWNADTDKQRGSYRLMARAAIAAVRAADKEAGKVLVDRDRVADASEMADWEGDEYLAATLRAALEET